MIATDNQTWQGSDKLYKQSPALKRWSDIFVKIGDGRIQFGLAGIYAIYGFIASNNRVLRTASQITEAVLASGAVVQVLIHITGRQSPFVSTRSGGRWNVFQKDFNFILKKTSRIICAPCM